MGLLPLEAVESLKNGVPQSRFPINTDFVGFHENSADFSHPQHTLGPPVEVRIRVPTFFCSLF